LECFRNRSWRAKRHLNSRYPFRSSNSENCHYVSVARPISDGQSDLGERFGNLASLQSATVDIGVFEDLSRNWQVIHGHGVRDGQRRRATKKTASRRGLQDCSACHRISPDAAIDSRHSVIATVDAKQKSHKARHAQCENEGRDRDNGFADRPRLESLGNAHIEVLFH
jgi:hypothetical protein